MSIAKIASIVLVLVGWMGLIGLADGQPQEQATSEPITTAPAERLAPFLSVIRQAEDPRTVMQAYARASAFGRDSEELQVAYMRRMLKLGLPHIAHHAARELIRLDQADGMAWALVGYIHGRRGELPEAFAATFRAAELLGDDASVLNNAGQLAAWYELEDDLPKVPDWARRSLANLHEDLAKKEQFNRAYRALQAAYTRQAESGAELDKKMAAALAEAGAVQRLAQDIDYRLQELNDQIDYHNRLIDGLWRELRSGYAYLRLHRDADGRYVYVPHSGRDFHREYLRERIREEEAEIEKIRLKQRKVRREGQGVVAELAKKEAALKMLRDQIDRGVSRVQRTFRWDPPAVDGVVTAEREDLPPPADPPKIEVPIDPETAARNALELAKLYLRHNMSEKALVLLETVVSKFPQTESAEQAGVLLSALKP